MHIGLRLSVTAILLLAGSAAHAATCETPPPICPPPSLEGAIFCTPGRPCRGTQGADIICGSPGDDVIAGGGGADIICGGAGNDRINGDPGDDKIDGGTDCFGVTATSNDDDVIRGGPGSDIIRGGAGDDRISSGTGADKVFGEDGDDTLKTGSSGADLLVGGPGDDVARAARGSIDICEAESQRGCEIQCTSEAPTTTTTTPTTTTTTTTIEGPIDVLPDTAEKLPNGTQQFIVASGPAGPYTWSVNGVDGGDATYGTIDGTGFYTAPAAVPVPATFNVCARVTATPSIFDCSTMTISPIPTAGEDVVVYNDINVLDDTSLADPNNILMVDNLLGYTTSGPRGTGTAVVLDAGHGPICGAAFCGSTFSTLQAEIASEGFTLTVDTSGDLSTIDGNVKVLFLYLPTVFYTVPEINAMKQFASQGGRIVFIGEHSGFYGGGFPAQNDFLSKMGAVMTNVGDAIDCGYNTLSAASLRTHQVTTGMTDVTIACSSQILLGPNDFALYYDLSNSRVLSGVAKIDTVPLPVMFALRAGGVSGIPLGWVATADAIGNPLP
jgi:hypothetical protein